MTTISKFYLLDAASPNTGTMPSNSPAVGGFLAQTATGDASGASTARDATDTAGASNPDIESSITANADVNQQFWGHRRFVSRPLAAQTVVVAAHTLAFSYARSESNLNHNQTVRCVIYAWRPSTGLKVGSANVAAFTGTEPTAASTEEAESRGQASGTDTAILDGDILVFDVYTQFTQGMSVAYTDQFAYDGTTEASTTTCASFVNFDTALTLFTASQVPHVNPYPPLLAQ